MFTCSRSNVPLPCGGISPDSGGYFPRLWGGIESTNDGGWCDVLKDALVYMHTMLYSPDPVGDMDVSADVRFAFLRCLGSGSA